MNQRMKKLSLDRQKLSYRLNLLFALFFVIPVAGILYLVFSHDILEDRFFPLVLILLLGFALLGYGILRNLFATLAQLSHSLARTVGPSDAPDTGNDEIGTIIHAVSHLEQSVNRNFQALNKKVSDITALKELSELCYITFDTEDLFYLTLERALKLVNAEIGSVLLLERPGRDFFTVQAAMGLDEFGERGRKIPFESSIAKYAVINKAPLRVEDIDKDTRFSGRSRSKYGNRSFLIMPLRTMREVLGVITFSKKRDGSPFTQEDVDLLTPLLSTAAFTYDNLAMDKSLKKSSRLLDTARKIIFLLASNMKPTEVLHGMLAEIRGLIPFDVASILSVDPEHPDELVVNLSYGADHQVVRTKRYPYVGTLFDRVMCSDTGCSVEVDKDLAEEAEREIVGHSGLRFAHVEPLKVQGRSAGILMVGTLQDQAFSPDEREQLRVLAGYLSLAVEKMQLLSMVDLGKRELDTLNRIGAALASSTFAADKVLEYTLDLVSASTHAEAACVLMREDDELTFRAVFQLDIEILKNTRLKMGQGLAGYCAARGEPVILGQQRDPIHLTPAVDAVTGFTTRNALAVPLIVHGKVIGVIEVLNKVGGDFSERESKLLQSIAGSVSIALENARLYQQIVADAENERAIRNVFQKFVPRVVVDKILQGAGTGTEGGIDEFKRITLLNIDIRGFSSMAKKVGPHQSVALLNEFFATMGSIVVLHGGIVDKYLGDGFLALFGAPVSTAHDADNAILSALLMRHALDQLNRTLPAEYGGEVSIGIAIHTGEVIVGNIGFEKKMDYTVIGDSVNAVFRLQNLTRNYPNGILITESTRRASMSFLNLREAGAYDIDATGGPLEIFEVIGINSKNRNEVLGKNEDGETRDGEEKTAIAT